MAKIHGNALTGELLSVQVGDGGVPELGTFTLVLDYSDPTNRAVVDAALAYPGEHDTSGGVLRRNGAVVVTNPPQTIPRWMSAVEEARTDLEAEMVGLAPLAHNHNAEYAPLVHTHAGLPLPAGIIVMWSGLISAIPLGWALCDGTGGTPDLRDKFIRGAAPGANPGATGGANTHTHAAHPALVHSGAAVADHASHTHTYTDVPNHTHPVNVTDPGHFHQQTVNSATTGTLSGYAPDTSTNTQVNSGYNTGSKVTGVTATTSNPTGGVATGTTAGPSATLTHAVTQPGNHAAQGHDTVANVPEYYALAFIIKL